MEIKIKEYRERGENKNGMGREERWVGTDGGERTDRQAEGKVIEKVEQLEEEKEKRKLMYDKGWGWWGIGRERGSRLGGSTPGKGNFIGYLAFYARENRLLFRHFREIREENCP